MIILSGVSYPYHFYSLILGIFAGILLSVYFVHVQVAWPEIIEVLP